MEDRNLERKKDKALLEIESVFADFVSQIETLEGDVEDKDKKIGDLEDEIAGLKDEIAELKNNQ